MKRTTKRNRDIDEAVRRVRAGDVDAYEVMYDTCDRPLRAFIRKRHPRLGPDFADEVAIRTHEAAVTRLGTYELDRGASVQTWLNWQSRNEARAVMQDWHESRFEQYDEDAHERWAVSSTGPAEDYQRAELSRALEEELANLPERTRTCITLFYFDDLNNAQTAAKLGVSYITARRIRAEGVGLLRHALEMRGFRGVERDSFPAPMWRGDSTTA